MDKKIRVLMVDDEDQFRATTKKILTRRGFETILAASGEEAILKLKEDPDVVILDIKMPGMDGHQALNKIKELIPDLPVIMLTGHGAMPSAQEAFISGAFDYLAKPCDMELLASKISEAHEQRRTKGIYEEKSVMDVMVPIDDFTTVNQDESIGETIQKLKGALTAKISTSRIMETRHRSVLVLDDKGTVQGILTITDLLSAIMPAYLSAPKPSTADSIQYSPMFWRGIFAQEVKKLAHLKNKDVMSPSPISINADANLMETAYTMLSNKVRRLLVVQKGKAVGIVREMDLFFQMAKILRSDYISQA